MGRRDLSLSREPMFHLLTEKGCDWKVAAALIKLIRKYPTMTEDAFKVHVRMALNAQKKRS